MKTIVVGILLFSSFSFASILPELHVTAVPNSPVIIPMGTVTIGNQTLQAPLYIVNSLVLKWDGKHDLIVDNITLTQENVDNPASCSFTGEELGQLYPANQNNIGQTIIRAGAAEVHGKLFGCQALKLPPVLPSEFDVPVKIAVSGYEVQDGAHPTPVMAVEHIHLQ